MNRALACVAVLMFLAPILWPILPGSGLAPFTPLLSVASILLVRYGPRQVPASCETLGALARTVAVLNFGKLSEICGRARPEDVWNALIPVVRECTGRNGRLVKETRFGPPMKRKGTTLYCW